MSKTLFIGIGATPQTWYRCALPAKALGQDWVGADENLGFHTGEIDGGMKAPNIEEYDTLVLQQPCGPAWLDRIDALKVQGKRVIYEIDDYLHGIVQVPDHAWRSYFRKPVLKQIREAIDACDELIVTTKYLGEQYKRRKPWHVCPNGIDLPRYDYHRHDTRDFLTVGWAGGTGHQEALKDWLKKCAPVMKEHDVIFQVIGARECAQVAFNAGLTVKHCPWTSFDTYPAAMTSCDVLLAPAGNTPWHRAKSDLRWLEASALKIPCVCDKYLYPEAKVRVDSAAEAAETLDELLRNPDLAERVGFEEYTHVVEKRSFPAAAKQWEDIL